MSVPSGFILPTQGQGQGQYRPAQEVGGSADYPSTSSLTTVASSAPQLVASTELVSGRLVKLKATLINILYMLPEKPMKFIDRDGNGNLDGSSNVLVSNESNSQGKICALWCLFVVFSIYVCRKSMSDVYSPACFTMQTIVHQLLHEIIWLVPISPFFELPTSLTTDILTKQLNTSSSFLDIDDIETQARLAKELKNERKLKRRQRRKEHYDRILRSIQQATKPEHILPVLVILC